MKHYLDGFDYVAAMLNYDCRNTPGRGNHFLVVLELETELKEQELLEKLAVLDPILSLFSGRMRRHCLHAAPYWMPGEPRRIRVVAGDELGSCLNTPLDGALEVMLLNQGPRHFLVFKFSHMLFDGRGAELLIEAVRSGDVSMLRGEPGLSSPKLNEWGCQFRSGRQVQRKMISFAAAGEIAGTQSDGVSANRYTLLSFSREKTEALTRFSEKTSGPFMLTPYLLSRICRSYALLLDELLVPGNILIPMSVDLRGRAGIARGAVFFNQWSLQPLMVPRELCMNPDAVFAELKGQIFENMSEQLPQAFRAASRLGRIASFPFLMAVVNKTKRTGCGTFMYSFLSESSLKSDEFCGHRILNLYHIPSMPPVTGAGIFMNSFGGALNVTLSYREDSLTPNAVRRFISSFVSALSKEAQ